MADFDFDDFDVSADPEPGTYDGVIKSLTTEYRNDTGEKYACLKIEIIGGDFNGVPVSKNFYFKSENETRVYYANRDFKQLLNALRIPSTKHIKQCGGVEDRFIKFDIELDKNGKYTSVTNFRQSDISLDNGNDSNANIPLSQSEEAPF